MPRTRVYAKRRIPFVTGLNLRSLSTQDQLDKSAGFEDITGVIKFQHPVNVSILNQPLIVVQLKSEAVQRSFNEGSANKYLIKNKDGEQIGYLMERNKHALNTFGWQLVPFQRPFTVNVYDNYGNIILIIKRTFSLINPRIRVFLPEENQPILPGALVGQVVKKWHMWKRKYDLFSCEPEAFPEKQMALKPFGVVRSSFLSQDFPVFDTNHKIIGGVDRNWLGLSYELFAESNSFMVRNDYKLIDNNVYPDNEISEQPLSLDQKAVLFANAITINFDYFNL